MGALRSRRGGERRGGEGEEKGRRRKGREDGGREVGVKSVIFHRYKDKGKRILIFLQIISLRRQKDRKVMAGAKRWRRGLYLGMIGAALAVGAGEAQGQDMKPIMTLVAPWQNVSSFTINKAENYVVFSQIGTDGRERAYEARHNGRGWDTPKPIKAINEVMAEATVGGLFMTDDEKRIYFHATREGSDMGYDIFYSSRENGEWGKPVRCDKICTNGDDTYPSVVPGEEGIYFLRHQVVSDEKQEKREKEKMTIYYAEKDHKKKDWGHSEPINKAVTFGYVQDARIASDGVSFYYCVRQDKRKHSVPTFSRRGLGDSWLLPETLIADEDNDFFSIQATEQNLVYIKGEGKKRVGQIYRTKITDPKYKAKATVTESGHVKSLWNGKPIVADMTVYDPTTHKVMGQYKSDGKDGGFHIVNLDKKSYIVEVRSDNQSFASYYLMYDGSGKPLIPKDVELFDTIQIGVTAYDSEIFKPIDGKVIAIRQSDKKVFRSTQDQPGWYKFRLPLGSDYNIVATAKNFDESKFLFKLGGDITFNAYERKLPLTPKKRDLKVKVLDMRTKGEIKSPVLFDNQMRDEKVRKSEGASEVKLREGDSYAVLAFPETGYAFAKTNIDMNTYKEEELTIELMPLVIGETLELKEVLFESAQSYLLTESYSELDQVVELMKNNPKLIVEIAAHTDDRGNAQYNLKLSERRAASAVDYLVDNGVPAERLQSKGYGKTKPKVPNDSEENRALNRRVEFIITGFTE